LGLKWATIAFHRVLPANPKMQLTVAEYIRKYESLGFVSLQTFLLTHFSSTRSLFAALFGNIVGALIVALPAAYFYLHDYDAGGLVTAENGHGGATMLTEADVSSNVSTQSGDKRPDTMVEHSRNAYSSGSR